MIPTPFQIARDFAGLMMYLWEQAYMALDDVVR